VEGVEGIVIDPTGQLEIAFAWGIRIAFNNEVEALALFQGNHFERQRNSMSISSGGFVVLGNNSQ